LNVSTIIFAGVDRRAIVRMIRSNVDATLSALAAQQERERRARRRTSLAVDVPGGIEPWLAAASGSISRSGRRS